MNNSFKYGQINWYFSLFSCPKQLFCESLHAFIILRRFASVQRHIDPVFEVTACPASGSDVPARYSNIPTRCQVQCGNDKQRSCPSSDTSGVLSHGRDSHILASAGAWRSRIHLEKPMLAVTMSTRLASLPALLLLHAAAACCCCCCEETCRKGKKARRQTGKVSGVRIGTRTQAHAETIQM